MTTPSQDQMTPQERYRIKNREKCLQRARAWRAANLERSREFARNWWKRKFASMSPDELLEHRKADVRKATRKYLERKELIFAAYGGYLCACCGEKEKSFLSIDHVEKSNAQMVKEGLYKRGSASFYNWLVKNKFPKGFQVLCMNCQFGKKHNNGVCPHQVRRNDYGASQ